MGIAIVVGVVEIGRLILQTLDQQALRGYGGLDAVNSDTLGLLATALFLLLGFSRTVSIEKGPSLFFRTTVS